MNNMPIRREATKMGPTPGSTAMQGEDSIFFFCVLRFYGPVNPMRSCRAWSVYLTTRLLGRLSPLSG